MAQNNWIATSLGTWTTAANWSLGHVPTSFEDAFIGTNGAIVGSGSNETVNSIGTGTNADVLLINGDSLFTAVNGTGPNENSGTIEVDNGSALEVFAGTFFNPGTLQLNSIGTTTSFFVLNVVTLDGGSTIEMSPSNNSIFGISALSQINNKNNDIAGQALINSVFFDNQTNGILETNSSLGTGVLSITGRLGFQNEGHVFADDGGTLVLGFDGTSQTIFNFGMIEALGASAATKIEIAGNLTVSGGGRIQFGGGNAAFDEIVSDGLPATLNLDGGTLDGAGIVGDSNLTLNIEQGAVVSADRGVLSLSAGAITNAGTLEATNASFLDLPSPITNDGVIVADGAAQATIGGAITGTGVVELGPHGRVDVTGTASVFNNIVFTGGSAVLQVGGVGVVEGDIVGAGAGSAIDVRFVVPTAHVVWQQNGGSGKLSLVDNNGTTLAGFTLEGQYTAADFSAASDGSGGTRISIINPAPPVGTTADMILRNFNTGAYEIYDIGSNTILSAHFLGQVATDFKFVGLGPFFSSDTTDMMLRSFSTGDFELYDISNNNITGAASLGAVGLSWFVNGFGNFSSNPGETDMILRSGTTGALEVYDISNNKITFAAPMGTVGVDWQPDTDSFGNFSVGNFSSLGESDMIMRSQTTGGMEVYDISHNQITNAAFMGTVGLDWAIVGVGDFSSNPGETDLMMRNGKTGAFELYDIANNQITNAFSIGTVGLDWFVAGFGPLNGAGTSDMALRNRITGALEVYDIANNQITNAVPMGSVGLDWNTGGIAADPPTASMGASDNSTAQLVQAMAGFGGGSGTGESLNTTPLSAETSQQPLLTTPQHA